MWDWLLLYWWIAFQDLYRFHPEAAKQHFKTEIQKPLQRAMERERKRNPRADRKPTRKEERELRKDKTFHDAFCNILVAAAEGKHPVHPFRDGQGWDRQFDRYPKDILLLIKALNRPICSLGFKAPPSPLGADDGPYGPVIVDGIRRIGEMLLLYLNVIYKSGPVHALCEVCGGLMTAGRGGKRVCSPECRGRKWDYPARKPYLEKSRAKRKAKDLRVKMRRLWKQGRHETALAVGEKLLKTGYATEEDKKLIEDLRAAVAQDRKTVNRR